MPLDNVQISLLKAQAMGLGIGSAPEILNIFIGRILHFSPIERDAILDAETLAGAAGELTRQRDDHLDNLLQIPPYVVYADDFGTWHISGLQPFLRNEDVPEKIVSRLANHATIRSTLQNIRKKHDFEVLAAAIMDGLWNFGVATRGSGDQGIDAIGLRELTDIHLALKIGDVSTKVSFPGEHVFIFASSKVTAITKRGKPTVIDPPHIRELIGGWVIQRSEQSAWREFNVKMMSPLQMILVTTYRLSVGSKALCRDIGVQVWGLPQLIFLICAAAPTGVFDAGYNFNNVEFGRWWRRKRGTRVSPVLPAAGG
jgi:hypothetical protein